ncbi:MAG: hypothetical protein K6G38_02025 [Gammaproteobacteria bacterium]|nr:hypothetical protein [Gammaproteobacteria bacterium]
MYTVEIKIDERKHANVVVKNEEIIEFSRPTTRQRVKELKQWYGVDYGTNEVDMVTAGSIVYWLTNGQEVI